METRFQQELNQLKSELLRMAGLAERAISNAVEALVKRDTSLAEKTIREDAQINDLKTSPFEHHANEVLPNIVHVSLDGA